MAQIDLQERFLLPGLHGSVDLDPLKAAFVAAAQRTASEISGVRADLGVLGWSVGNVAETIGSLERAVGVRLEYQTQVLSSQLAVLQSIDAALRSPAKVRAAERMGDAAGLLQARRYERALGCAHEAIDCDPNNPAGFAAAGWALAGLGRLAEAGSAFAEAWVAGWPNDASLLDYARQASRCYLAVGELERARPLLKSVLESMGVLVQQGSFVKLDFAPLYYDAALAASAAEDESDARQNISAAVDLDPRFAEAAVAEPLFEGREGVVREALAVAQRVERARARGERTDSPAGVRARAKLVAEACLASRASSWPYVLWEHPTGWNEGDQNWKRVSIRLALSEQGEVQFGSKRYTYSAMDERWRSRLASDEELRFPDFPWRPESSQHDEAPGVVPFSGVTQTLSNLRNMVEQAARSAEEQARREAQKAEEQARRAEEERERMAALHIRRDAVLATKIEELERQGYTLMERSETSARLERPYRWLSKESIRIEADELLAAEGDP